MGVVTSMCCTGRAQKTRTEQQLKVLIEALCYVKFKEPAEPIGAAGGTAAFYRLTPQDKTKSQEEWLGKDLAHAFDELEFYEAAKKLRGQQEWALLGYMIEYGGALKDFPVRWSGGDEQMLDLLVMRSLVEGFEKPRLLDLKIGAKTSAANWKGKSAMASLKQGMLDSITNSASEGLRLEGFLNPPEWIDSEDPLHDVGGGEFWAKGKAKKARRFYFQRMSTAEVLAALVDFRELTQDPQCLWPCECAEMALLAMVRDLGGILRACNRIPVPQKWIGSSVAVVAEAGAYPPRPHRGAQPQGSSHKACVRIFDWGRSELNTPARHSALGEEQRGDRQEYWSHYQAGISRLLWEAARLYWNSFCASSWTSIHVTVYDYDSQTQDDLLGFAEAALPSEAGGEASLALPLTNCQGKQVLGEGSQPALVNLKVSFSPCPAPSRLRGCWRVRVASASHLPIGDLGLSSASSSDPYAVVALSEGPPAGGQRGPRRTQARTAVISNSLNPAWEEDVCFAVAQASGGSPEPEGCEAAGEASLSAALAAGGAPGSLAGLFPAPRDRASLAEPPSEETELLKAFAEQLCNG